VPRPQKHLKILGDAIRASRRQGAPEPGGTGRKAGLHLFMWEKWERGEQWISLHALLRVAAALKIRVRDLVKEL